MTYTAPTSEVSRWGRYWSWLGLVARLVLGAVWITAGALKLPDPAESIRAVRAYRLLPEAIVPTIGYGLPVLEVTIGLLLIVGLWVRLASAVSLVLLAGFIIGISSAWARGLQIDCGCFGGGGQVAAADTHYPEEIARDSALFVAALLLLRWPRTRLALSSVLAGPAGSYRTIEDPDLADDSDDDDALDQRQPWTSTGDHRT